MKNQTVKSILFGFLFHALSVINTLLYQQAWIADTVWFALQIIICIVAFPIYFFVKCTPTNKWVYTLTSLIAHVFFTLFACFALGNIFNGWDGVILYWTEIFLSATVGVILLIDVLVNAKASISILPDPKR